MSKVAGYRALVTGATGGIGREIARLLAAKGCDLVLSSRNDTALEALRKELGVTSSVAIDCVSADLSREGEATRLWLEASREPIHILINNAGIGRYQNLAESEWSDIEALMQLNMRSLTELSQRFVSLALPRPQPSYLLNVSSLAALVPMKHFAVYCGSKAYVRAFTESLALELANSPVRVSCLVPGGTNTDFVERAGQELGAIAQKTLMSPARCARVGVDGMLRGKTTIIPGASNKLISAGSRIFPRRAMGRVSTGLIGAPAWGRGSSKDD